MSFVCSGVYIEAEEGVGASRPSDSRKRSPAGRGKSEQEDQAKRRRENVAREDLMKAATISAGPTTPVRRDDGKSQSDQADVVESERQRATRILKERSRAPHTDQATPSRRGESHANTHTGGDKSAPGDKLVQLVRQLHKIVAPVAIPACIGIGKPKPIRFVSKHEQAMRDRSQEREEMATCYFKKDLYDDQEWQARNVFRFMTVWMC